MEGSPENHGAPASYLQTTIKEAEGFIAIFSDEENLFSVALDKMGAGIRAKAIQSYQDELKVLHSLDPATSDEDVDALHQIFEELRKNLLKS